MLREFLINDSKILATVNTPPMIALMLMKNFKNGMYVIVYLSLIGLNSYLKKRAGKPS